FFLFFFSSRRRHTRFSRDWSSDVCSSDLELRPLVDLRGEADPFAAAHRLVAAERERSATYCRAMVDRQLYTYTLLRLTDSDVWRSEERRVGKERGTPWPASHLIIEQDSSR